jgi:hypothetical protein
MRELLEHLMEDDVFKPADKEEMAKRKEAAKVARDVRRREYEKETGKKVDTCPHCDVDLREVGIDASETSYSSVSLYYEEDWDNWEWGDSDTNDSEITSYRCADCQGELRRGRDFDIEASH